MTYIENLIKIVNLTTHKIKNHDSGRISQTKS